jgi:murein DD-endopeptidase MepM/ murein hydrolase activator NlpD
VGHHRADVPPEARRDSVTHSTPLPQAPGTGSPGTRGRRAADVPVDSPSTSLLVADIRAEAARQAEQAAYVGRRRAAVPDPAPVPSSPEVAEHEAAIVSEDNVARVLESLVPADQTTGFENEDTTKLRLDRDEPAQVTTTYVNATPAPAGKRRAHKPARHTGTRGPLFRSLPSVPVLAGVAALALSIGGVVTVDDQAPVSGSGGGGFIQGASALTGSSGFGSVTERDDETSRDSARDAQQDAAGDEALQEAVNGMVEVRAGALAKTAAKAEKHAAYLALDQWNYPLDPIIITARFGQYGLWSSYHTGIDFNGNTGDPISAMTNGVVTEAGYDGAYGNKTVVTLDDGTEIWYCHQNTIGVSVGETVTRGEVIGTVGATGNVTGSHLHVEVRPGGGDPVDPYAAMQQHGLF